MARLSRGGVSIAALLACGAPLAALAQGGDFAPADGGGQEIAPEAKSAQSTRRDRIAPYIEAAQMVTAELSPGDDVLTYSRLAAGVDANIVRRNSGASMSVRYERNFGWGKAADSDFASGVARGYTMVSPGLQIEGGALATRTYLDGGSAGAIGQLDRDMVTQVYSLYAGPSLATKAGDFDVNASYMIGYSKVEAPDAYVAKPGQPPVDVFDDSIAHNAQVRAGVKPDVVLPVGVGVGASYYREDVSNLDQRVEDFNARADVTVPVSSNVALVGGVGYEKVEVSMRDARRDADGLPIVDRQGRYVTDKSAPRLIAYDTDGLTWDAGVIWRPSRRTALEAHVGRRYGATTYYGSFAYAPTARSSFNVSVYDNVAGFGGQMNRNLAELPTDFEAVRDILNGGVSPCVISDEQSGCFGNGLGSVRSSAFRARGVMASYGLAVGKLHLGLGGGYDRRRYFAARGSVLDAMRGVVDERYWLAGTVTGKIDEQSGFTALVHASWFTSTYGPDSDATSLQASASYYRSLTRHLSATAAVGLDGITRDSTLADDFWGASAQVGVRYSF